MAKEIKAIVCPQCGATDQKTLKPGFYRCGRCQTEYFIDDDDVTVTHLHQWVAPAPAAPASPGRGFVIGMLSVMVAAIAGLGLFTRTDPSRPAASVYTRPEELKTDPNVFSWSSARSRPLVVGGRPGAAGARPLVLVVGKREYKDAHGFSADADQRNGLYVSLYDPLTGRDTRTQRLALVADAPSRRTWLPQIDLQVFGDGTPYIVIDKSQIFAVDPVTLTATDVTTKFFARQAELAAGVATIQFDDDRWGDGLELLVNDGRKYHYYPLVDKLYDEDAWYRASRDRATALPDAAPRTYFTFTGRSFQFPNAPQQLLRVRYLANAGGPEYKLENPTWSRNYGGSGFFTENDPHSRELIGANEQRASRILGFKDLTPGRRYFDPDIRYADASALLITLRTTAAPNAPLLLQCLDPTTGAIRWTTPLGDDDATDHFTRFADGFVGTDGTDCTVYGTNGKVRRSRELKYEAGPVDEEEEVEEDEADRPAKLQSV